MLGAGCLPRAVQQQRSEREDGGDSGGVVSLFLTFCVLRVFSDGPQEPFFLSIHPTVTDFHFGDLGEIVVLNLLASLAQMDQYGQLRSCKRLCFESFFFFIRKTKDKITSTFLYRFYISFRFIDS